MSSEKPLTNEVQDVPQKIFEKFLEELKNVEVSSDVVDRLKVVILSEDTPSEQTLKTALFSDTQSL